MAHVAEIFVETCGVRTEFKDQRNLLGLAGMGVLEIAPEYANFQVFPRMTGTVKVFSYR